MHIKLAIDGGARGGQLPVMRGRGRRVAVIAGVVVAIFAAATARLFVFPAQGMPAHVDAIVMLDGSNGPERVGTALRLAREGRAPALLISRGSWHSVNGSCPRSVPGVTVTCFNPKPPNTQGEAEFAGRLARQHHWTSVALVTAAAQDTRARLRLSRCFPGQIYVMTAPMPARQWPFAIAYEWGATLKALLVQRGC